MGVPLPVRSLAAARGWWKEPVRRTRRRRRSHRWTTRGKERPQPVHLGERGRAPGGRSRGRAPYPSGPGRSFRAPGWQAGPSPGVTPGAPPTSSPPAGSAGCGPDGLWLGRPAALLRAGAASRDVGRSLVCCCGAWGRLLPWAGRPGRGGEGGAGQGS